MGWPVLSQLGVDPAGSRHYREARKVPAGAGVPHEYLECGSYFSQ